MLCVARRAFVFQRSSPRRAAAAKSSAISSATQSVRRSRRWKQRCRHRRGKQPDKSWQWQQPRRIRTRSRRLGRAPIRPHCTTHSASLLPCMGNIESRTRRTQERRFHRHSRQCRRQRSASLESAEARRSLALRSSVLCSATGLPNSRISSMPVREERLSATMASGKREMVEGKRLLARNRVAHPLRFVDCCSCRRKTIRHPAAGSARQITAQSS